MRIQSNMARLEKISEIQHVQFSQHIAINDYQIDFLLSGKKYIPSPTGLLLHQSNNILTTVKGPYGSGKTTMCIMDILLKTCAMQEWFKGRRKARWCVVRNTTPELASTTLKSWDYWYEGLGNIAHRSKPLLTREYEFNDGKGVIELEVIFLPLDREDDLRKVKSLEVTGVYFNELCELPAGVVSHFGGRINRYPPPSQLKGYWSGMIADTNPPDSDSWMYRTFEHEKPKGYLLLNQPPGLIKEEGSYKENPKCDNRANLSDVYYTTLATGQTEEFIKVYCLGEYGTVIFGKKCYPEYNDDLHSVEYIDALAGVPIHLGFDFGLDPTCVIVQMISNGQIRIIDEVCSENMSLTQMIEMRLMPLLASKYKDFEIGDESVGDPSGNTPQDTDGKTCLMLLRQFGLKVRSALTNDIVPRLNAVKFFLNRLTDGKPSLLLSRQSCPVLRKGFLGKYHFKRVSVIGEERYHDKPNKNEYSHPQDALQYICLAFAHEKVSSANKAKAINISNPVMRL